jgi:hypothetical protein
MTVSSVLGEHEGASPPGWSIQLALMLLRETSNDEYISKVGGKLQAQLEAMRLRIVVFQDELVTQRVVPPIGDVTPTETDVPATNASSLHGIRKQKQGFKGVLVVRHQGLKRVPVESDLVAAQKATISRVEPESVSVSEWNAPVRLTQEIDPAVLDDATVTNAVA